MSKRKLGYELNEVTCTKCDKSWTVTDSWATAVFFGPNDGDLWCGSCDGAWQCLNYTPPTSKEEPPREQLINETEAKQAEISNRHKKCAELSAELEQAHAALRELNVKGGLIETLWTNSVGKQVRIKCNNRMRKEGE